MDHLLTPCLLCQERPRRTAHRNTRYCEPCRAQLLRQPRSALTPDQVARLEQLAGTMFRREIAAALGVSPSQVARYLRDTGRRSNARYRLPAIVEAVCAAYGALGKKRTQALFPEVNVRAIVEHHRTLYAPRQVQWTGEQLLEAARMAGLVSQAAQARYFGRPNAGEESIPKLWVRVFHCAPRHLHGLGMRQVWRLCTAGVTTTLVCHAQRSGVRSLGLWLDLVDHLRDDVEPWVREAVQVLAQFQQWLFGMDSSEPIRRMIHERETAYGNISSVSQRHDTGTGTAHAARAPDGDVSCR